MAFIGYNRYVVKISYAGVAQSVVQLIRNQQVVCSSHITSSKPHSCEAFLRVYTQTEAFDMTPVDIIAQIISIVGMLMGVLSYQQKGKARILFFQLLGSALFVVHFYMIGAYMGAILNLVAIIRALIFIYEDKIHAEHPAWTIGFILIYILSYVAIFTIPNEQIHVEPTAKNLILEVLPVIAMTVTTIAFRYKDDKILRRVAFISSPLWLIYNSINFSSGGIIGETLNLSSAIVGTIRFDRKKEEEKAE